MPRQRWEASDERIRAAEAYAEQLGGDILGVDAYRSAAKLARDMAEAMRSRVVIEQAKGILMADNRISDEAAFEQLSQRSQNANMKLRDVAQRLVQERTTPLD